VLLIRRPSGVPIHRRLAEFLRLFGRARSIRGSLSIWRDDDVLAAMWVWRRSAHFVHMGLRIRVAGPGLPSSRGGKMVGFAVSR